MATALTATLRADITQFEKAITTAETKITGLSRSTTQVNTELKKFGNEFGGATLIRQANLMAKAVEDIGGVTKLTTAEQKKLSGSVDEALAKYRALGQEVPPSLVKISTELGNIRKAEEEATRAANELAAAQKKAVGELASGVDKAKGAFGAFDFGIKSIGAGIAGAFTVGAVINFGKSVVELGSQITDLSQRTGLSVEAVQEFKYIAEQTGSSIETFAAATSKLSDRLVSGEKGTVNAVKELGLSLADLQRLSPEQAFTQIADAVGKIPDPMKQTQLAMDLFGKSGTEILPAIKAGFSDLRQEARDFGQVLSKESVAALDDFGDRFGRLMSGLKVVAAQTAISISDSLTSGWKRFLDAVAEGIQSGPAGFGAGFGRSAITASIKPRERESDISLDTPGGSSAGTTNFVAALKAAREELAKLTTAEREQIKAAKELDASNEDIAKSLNEQHKGLNLTAQAIGIYLDGIKQTGTAINTGFTANLKKAADEAKRAAQDIEKLGGVTKLDAKQREDANKILYEGVRAMRALGQETTPAAAQVKRLADATFELKDPLRFAANNTEAMVKAITSLKAPALEPWQDFAQLKYENLQKMLSDVPKVANDAQKFGVSIKEAADAQKEADIASKDWLSSIGGLSNAFAEFAQISGEGLDGTIGKIAQLISLMNIGAQAGAGLKDAFGKGTFGAQQLSLGGFRNQDGQFTAGSVLSGGAQAAQAGFSAYGALNEATNVKGRGNRALRGAATGAAIGNSIVPGYGALVGAAVGALVGAFRNPAFEDVYKRVARNFGVAISDETAKAIAKTAKDTFKGDRAAAEIFSLDTIIAEGGGINDSNVKQLQARLRDAFSMKDVGKFSKEQLDEVLEKNFGAFAQYVTSQTEIASQGFSEILRLAKDANATTEEMRQFVSGQAGVIGGGLSALAGPLAEQAEAFNGTKDQIAQLQAERDKLAAGGKNVETGDLEKYNRELKEAEQNVKLLKDARDDVAAKRLAGLQSGEFDDTFSPDTKEGGGFREIDNQLTLREKQLKEAEELYDRIKNSRDKALAGGAVSGRDAGLDELDKQLADLTAKMQAGAQGAQAEFDRLGVVALAGFNAARESGLGFLESLDQIGPGLDQLVGIQQSLGLESNAALAELLKFRELVGQNETLVASAEALNETVRALSNIGGLTTESLAAMEGQGLQTFERLTAAGFSNNQALELMAGFLENVKLAHEQLGTPIDENTAKLIEQAEAQGILKDAANDTNSILKEGIGALIEAVGGRLPEAWKKAAQAAKDAASATNRSTDAAEQAVRDQERVIDSGSGAWEDYKDSGVLSQEEIRKEIDKTGDKLRNDFPTEIKIKVRFDVEDAPEMPSGSVGGSGSGFAYIPPGTVTGPNGESVGTGGSSPNLPGEVNSSISVPELAAPVVVVNMEGLSFRGEVNGNELLRFNATRLPRYIETRTGQRTAA
jgi:ribosomal protein L10